MFLALKELKYSKLRFFMIGAILMMISWLVFILSGLGNGLSTLSAATFKNMDAQYVVFEDDARHSMLRSVISADLIDELKEFDTVKSAAPMGSQTAVVMRENATDDEEKTDVSFIGIVPGSFLEPEAIEGEQLSEDEHLKVLANDSLKNEGFAIGDTLNVDGYSDKLEIVGFVENESFNHLPSIFMTIDQWRNFYFAAPGSTMGIDNPVNAIMLQGENIDPEAIEAKIDGIEMATKQEAINGIPGYKEENGTIMLMLSFLAIISAFVVTVFFYVLTLQKTNQFGVMKAIGASNRFLGRTVVAQVFVLSVISIGAGILLTYGTAAIFPDSMPFALDPMLVAVYAIALLIVSILSSLLSVRRISKIDPLEAIGRVE